jgi:hypothetical protein
VMHVAQWNFDTAVSCGQPNQPLEIHHRKLIGRRWSEEEVNRRTDKLGYEPWEDGKKRQLCSVGRGDQERRSSGGKHCVRRWVRSRWMAMVDQCWTGLTFPSFPKPL